MWGYLIHTVPFKLVLSQIDDVIKDTTNKSLSLFYLNEQETVKKVCAIMRANEKVDDRPRWKILKDLEKCDVLSIPEIEVGFLGCIIMFAFLYTFIAGGSSVSFGNSSQEACLQCSSSELRQRSLEGLSFYETTAQKPQSVIGLLQVLKHSCWADV